MAAFKAPKDKPASGHQMPADVWQNLRIDLDITVGEGSFVSVSGGKLAFEEAFKLAREAGARLATPEEIIKIFLKYNEKGVYWACARKSYSPLAVSMDAQTKEPKIELGLAHNEHNVIFIFDESIFD